MTNVDFFKKFFGNNTEKITIEKIQDFYQYSEVAKCVGRSRNNRMEFGSSFYIDNTRENGKITYNSIMFASNDKWAHISIENENVKYQYTENGDLRSIIDCPVTTNEKEISLITEVFFSWYKELKLPNVIEKLRKHVEAGISVSMIKEIEINAFGDNAVLRIMSDKKTFLLFNSFPPRKGKLTKQQADDFETILAAAIKKKVIHDDRELFVIFDDSQKMIDDVISFLQSFN